MIRSLPALLRRCAALILISTLVLISIFTANFSAVHAATNWIVTTTNDDAAGGTCGTPCTLRDALNSAVSGDSISFANGLSGIITLTNGGLTISKNITILGPGQAALSVSGNNAVTIFTVNSGVTAAISGLTLQAGNGDSSQSGCGGAIYSQGTLTVSYSSFVSNAAASGAGGGICNEGLLLTVNNSLFTNNTAGDGGAIKSVSGSLVMTYSTISNNSAGHGAGISVSGGRISNSTFLNNSAAVRAGALDVGGNTTVSNSTFTGNSAGSQGGGAITVEGSGTTLTLSNSTVASNTTTASGNGGGVGVANQGTLQTLSNIIAKNTASGTGPDINTESGAYAGHITSLGYNLIGDGTGSSLVAATGDQIGTSGTPIDPLLGILASNGGPTQTLAITSSSPAYQKGFCGGNNTVTPNAPAVLTDQRGTGYGRNPICDTGAYEANPVMPATNTPTSTSTNTPTNTATNTPTNTATSTPSNTATFTPSNTPTNTATNTATFTPSNTPTNTATNTATFTPSNTPTNTLTNTPTNTSTATVTSTSTTVPVGKIDSIGVYRAGTFYLRLHNNTGFADLSAAFTAGSKPYPVVGDWTGVGFDSIGVMDQATANFYLRNTISAGSANEIFTFGNPNDTPLAGRWQVSATHAGAGVYRPNNGILYLKNALSTGFADYGMVLGLPGDEGIAGDWTGKGFDSPGVYRPGNLEFYLSNQVTNGVVFANISLTYGNAADLPIAGDWIAQGHDGIGMFRPTSGFVYLKNTLTTGFADNAFLYGATGDQPVAGHWQAIYPPAPPAPILIAKTAAPNNNGGNGIVPGGNQIGG